MELEELVAGLRDPDEKRAYQCLKQLTDVCERSKDGYAFFDVFAGMLEDKNSYVRTRGIRLIAANAKWDTDLKIDKWIKRFLKHIQDEKPITARQCIKSLPGIAQAKPKLAADICAALRAADAGIYPDTMQPLVAADIRAALEKIGCGTENPDRQQKDAARYAGHAEKKGKKEW